MNERPEWVKAVHDDASETMRKVSDWLLDKAEVISTEESRVSDGVIYIPIIVMAAVHEGSLIGSLCQFGTKSSSESVAQLLRFTAEHLDGKAIDGQFVAERGIIKNDS
ncbi:hypothetical protein I7F13_23360 [Sinorhizobium meliloti]|uniref:hypothetical protein n=1 Tax=Sinorhizobium TaxID=28105 RepID=UPI000C7DD1FF|nr:MULTISPECIES: hypothetical protein [Sinorhizobium]MCM5690141.1 hypothetical protein [Sinorhizobium meliloti]MDE3825114.1 hypothetical protein [Sinorhizobium meliloti]MDW9600201.1 hypothetical protein [Sinorhizobium meliloti]MDX0517714.1 hypothetical protein [Sinorhizobium medicae]MDX0566664.1 hypothetical protein [Sinorhizobium medicae]